MEIEEIKMKPSLFRFILLLASCLICGVSGMVLFVYGVIGTDYQNYFLWVFSVPMLVSAGILYFVIYDMFISEE